ncbi:MAG: hypothetical protein FWC01_01515 [Treponema sp.]|nr:hypothetical protein [Treponema sp.]MCL2236884.1 hypothetical protein [Treponema sp.]
MTFSEKIKTPFFIFMIYMTASILLILLFRFIYPGSEAPLLMYSRNWRIVQGFLEVFNLFPALALSALVIPFGLASFEENYQSFSDVFFKRLVASVVTAIFAAVVYGIIFFFALPMLKNYEENMRYTGYLYHLARDNAIERRNEGEWFEAQQFINICDRIWFQNTDLDNLRDEIVINMERLKAREEVQTDHARAALTREHLYAGISPLSDDQQPVTAGQAIAMSRNAFERERYFDAHWLANLGSRLAARNSVEAVAANALAGEAWEKIASLAPDKRETRIHELFQLKLDGYISMQTGDWIRAYYIFQELLSYTPDDPDAINFFKASETGAKETAFFIDEMELSVGEILTGAVFSLPVGDNRAVMRFSSLTLTNDVAYGFGLSYMDVDEYMILKSNGTARYAKLIPITIHNKPQVLVLTHSLDRYNKDRFFESEWLVGREPLGGIILDISYEDFLLTAKARHGLDNLQIDELFAAANRLNNAGYVQQIFQAEVLNRLGSALFFLPMAIFVIIISWRYRARQRPRYLFVLLLPVLPVVFNGFVFLYRSVFNTLGIWLVLTIGFSAALAVYIAILAVSLLVSLISLSAQHS